MSAPVRLLVPNIAPPAAAADARQPLAKGVSIRLGCSTARWDITASVRPASSSACDVTPRGPPVFSRRTWIGAIPSTWLNRYIVCPGAIAKEYVAAGELRHSLHTGPQTAAIPSDTMQYGANASPGAHRIRFNRCGGTSGTSHTAGYLHRDMYVGMRSLHAQEVTVWPLCWPRNRPTNSIE